MEYLGLEQIKCDKFCPENKGTAVREKEKKKKSQFALMNKNWIFKTKNKTKTSNNKDPK